MFIGKLCQRDMGIELIDTLDYVRVWQREGEVSVGCKSRMQKPLTLLNVILQAILLPIRQRTTFRSILMHTPTKITQVCFLKITLDNHLNPLFSLGTSWLSMAQEFKGTWRLRYGKSWTIDIGHTGHGLERLVHSSSLYTYGRPAPQSRPGLIGVTPNVLQSSLES